MFKKWKFNWVNFKDFAGSTHWLTNRAASPLADSRTGSYTSKKQIGCGKVNFLLEKEGVCQASYLCIADQAVPDWQV